MDYTALHHDIPHHTGLDWALTAVVVLATVYGLCMAAHWYSTGASMLTILKRQWHWLLRR